MKTAIVSYGSQQQTRAVYTSIPVRARRKRLGDRVEGEA